MLDDVLLALSSRLPELEWKLGLQTTDIHPNLLPKGLFRHRFEFTSQSCIEEIKADIESIKKQNTLQSAHYLAKRVSQKINVLVKLSQHLSNKKQPDYQPSFGIQAIGTRQQWLKTMHDEVDRLREQHQALNAALIKLIQENNTKAILALQVDIGHAERRLTLAKETLARATMI